MRLAVLSACLLSGVSLLGCSSTALGDLEPDGGRPEGDAAPTADAWRPDEDAAAPRDAGLTDALVPDTGAPEGRCFPDVELVSLTGGREFVEPGGLFAYDGGWLALYQASAGGGSPTGGTFERAAVFLDREGRITSRQVLAYDGFARGGRAVLGRFLFASYYDATDLYEIGDGELIQRTELLDPVPPGRIAAVEREGDRLRVLSQTWADTAGSFRFAYSEVVLGDDGSLTTLSAELPPIETIGSPALMAGLGRYHEIHSFAMHDDTFVFAFPTGEDEYEIDGHVWNVVRVALDRSALETGVVSWSVIDETRWEEGPIAVFGALPDLDLVITGRWVTGDDGGAVSRVLAERFDPAAPPVFVGGEDLFPRDQVGPATVYRRGDVLGLATPNRFVAISLPSLEETASTPLELGYGTIRLWDEDVVLELGQLGTLGVLRCHALP